MLKAANEFKLLRFAPAEISRMRLELQKRSLSSNPQLRDVGAVALCGFFLNNYPIITALYEEDINLFKKYCCCTNKRDLDNDDTGWWTKVNSLWSLLKSTLLPVLRLARKALPVSTRPLILLRGVTFNSFYNLE